MEILSFDISGKFAHFRKFYSNSTALSFTLPPRTTIIGILAGMLGREKESYYEEFSSDKIRISASLKSLIKKQIHRLNYLKVEAPADFRGKKLHVQTPFEVVSSKRINKEPLVYRIYLSYYEESKNLFEEIREKMEGKNFAYSLSLGTAFFLANIENVKIYSSDEISEKTANNEIINFNSAVNSEKVVELSFDRNTVKDFFIEEEQMPADFKGNYDRETVKMNKLIYIDGGKILPVRFTGNYFEITTVESKINIDFWE
jgi:CRISPR-associated protein Cas5h